MINMGDDAEIPDEGRVSPRLVHSGHVLRRPKIKVSVKGRLAPLVHRCMASVRPDRLGALGEPRDFGAGGVTLVT